MKWIYLYKLNLAANIVWNEEDQLEREIGEKRWAMDTEDLAACLRYLNAKVFDLERPYIFPSENWM